MVRNYIGLALTQHDPAIAIVNSSGELVFAEAIERYHQVKRAWNCVPDDLNRICSLTDEYCKSGCSLVAARSWSRKMPGILRSFYATRPAVSGFQAVRETLGRSSPDEALGFSFVEAQARWLSGGLDAELQQAGSNVSWRVKLETNFGGWDTVRGPVEDRAYDHHLAHAANACFSSPYADAVCAIVDGYGEKAATTFWHYKGDTPAAIGPRRKLGLPTSLGIFYLILCRACGFDPYKGEEWKVMGLAPYGTVNPELYDLLRPMLRVDGLEVWSPSDEAQRIGTLLANIRPSGSDPLESADLARTGQVVFSEVCHELLCNLHGLGLSDNLVLGGGCALNSAWNGHILERTPFQQLFVPCAPADDSNAAGAAWLAFRQDNPDARSDQSVQPPFPGSRMSPDGLQRLVKFSGLSPKRLAPEEVANTAAKLLSEGAIVGWVQGRAEFGPRALGNRSILADPRRADIKDRLNAEVKYREEFRPFAPAILEESGRDYFADYQPSPYMERTLSFREDVKEKVPGVVHVDGTGRLQTVTREFNPRYYDVIASFGEVTGVPVLLNTSFNVMGKPIIHSVEDAVAVFQTSGLDAVIIEDLLLEKPNRQSNGGDP